MLNREIPFLRIGLPFCAGIISGRCVNPETGFFVVIIILIAAGFAASLFFNNRIVNLLYGFTLTCALFLSGLFLYNYDRKSISDLEPVTNELVCILSEYPEEKENSSRMLLKLDGLRNGETINPLKGSILAYRSKNRDDYNLLPGDVIIIRCRPAKIQNRGNPCEFDYKFYMENHGIRYMTFIDENDILGHYTPEHRKLAHKALIIREKIIDMYRNRGISGDRLALVAAITLGQKNLLDDEQKQYFIKAGVMHIMAVSGLHAVILSMFIQYLLFFLKGRFAMLRIILTVLFLWAFAFVTGLTPSVLRATIMVTFIQTGKLLGRNANSLNSVLASAFFLLLWKPPVLFDAGFLLSYSAVIFIICFYEKFYHFLNISNWLAEKIWQSAVVTVVAQAGTLALTISLFNRFPTYFIITNILIVPLSNILIITGCLIPLTYPILFLSRPLAGILETLTGVTEELTKKAASLPFSTIDNIGMGTLSTVILIVFIFLLFLNFSDHRKFPLRHSLIALLVFNISLTTRDLLVKNTDELIVYNTTYSYCIGIRNGRSLDIFTPYPAVPEEISRHCACRNLKIRVSRITNENMLLKAGDHKILLARNPVKRTIADSDPDYMIIYGNVSRFSSRIPSKNHLNAIIFTKSAGSADISDVKEAGFNIHHVKTSGAFIAGLPEKDKKK
ncbi:MAG: ComEC family competence protein [Bacteroidales bacterium]|nr:ComEC family competence protein [Bacteroidales bacterium]